MHALAPDRVAELVDVYRAHNEPLHEELVCCAGMDDVLVRLKDEGRRLGIVTAKRRQDGRPGIRAHPDRAPVRDGRRRRRDRAAQARSGAAAARTRRGWARQAERGGYVGDAPFDIKAAKAAGLSPSASHGAASMRVSGSRPRSRTRSSRRRRSFLASSKAESRSAPPSCASPRLPPLPLPRPRRSGDLRRRVRQGLRRARRARGVEPGVSSHPTRRPSASARRPRTSSSRSSTRLRWARSRR